MHRLFAGDTQVVKDGHLAFIDQQAPLQEVRSAARRIAGRHDLKIMIKLRWPVE